MEGEGRRSPINAKRSRETGDAESGSKIIKTTGESQGEITRDVVTSLQHRNNQGMMVDAIDEDEWQPSSNDAHLSMLGGPMRKVPRGNKRPNPLQTSWGSTSSSNSDALSAPQRLFTHSSKTKKSRSSRSKPGKNRNSSLKG